MHAVDASQTPTHHFYGKFYITFLAFLQISLNRRINILTSSNNITYEAFLRIYFNIGLNKLRVTDAFSTDKHQILLLDSFIISIPKTQKIILDHCFQYAVTCDLLCKDHIGVGHKIYTKYYELSGGRILYSLSIVVSPIVGLCRKFKSTHVVCVRAYSFFIDIFSSKIFLLYRVSETRS